MAVFSCLHWLHSYQVGSEGLDFGRCNLVIAFDLPHNMVEYMQVGVTWCFLIDLLPK